MWKQTRKFNQSNATTQAGYCLRNVRTGYGIAPKYATAWDSWINSTRRTGAIPSGVDVPIYFSYYLKINNLFRNYGHVGVQLADGRFWSDGTIYSSLWRYRITHPAVLYKGWSEEVNDVAVMKWEDTKYNMPSVGSKIKLAKGITRTTFVAGTTKVAGKIYVKDNTYIYTVRGYDPVYKNRIIINSASGGGNGVALALYYINGNKIDGWSKV